MDEVGALKVRQGRKRYRREIGAPAAAKSRPNGKIMSKVLWDLQAFKPSKAVIIRFAVAGSSRHMTVPPQGHEPNQ